MKIGIGLPATIPGVDGGTVVVWARRADKGPFHSLGIIDRIAYGNQEPMVALGAAAAATSNIRLMSTVLVAPVRDPVLLAKQAATLDVISGERVTLGLGLGGRKDDYDAAGASYHRRGRRLEEQVQIMKRVWAGHPPYDGLPPVGPAPGQQGGPELLIGAGVPAGITRAARLADGFISMPNTPDGIRENWGLFMEEWHRAGRQGTPRLLGAVYYALGDPDVVERGQAYLKDYYRYLGGEMAQYIANAMLSDRSTVRQTIQAFEDLGMDEMVFWPCVPELEQVDRLEEVASKVAR